MVVPNNRAAVKEFKLGHDFETLIFGVYVYMSIYIYIYTQYGNLHIQFTNSSPDIGLGGSSSGPSGGPGGASWLRTGAICVQVGNT